MSLHTPYQRNGDEEQIQIGIESRKKRSEGWILNVYLISDKLLDMNHEMRCGIDALKNRNRKKISIALVIVENRGVGS